MISKVEPSNSRLRVNLSENRDIGNFFWRFGFPDAREEDLIGMQDVCGLDPFITSHSQCSVFNMFPSQRMEWVDSKRSESQSPGSRECPSHRARCGVIVGDTDDVLWQPQPNHGEPHKCCKCADVRNADRCACVRRVLHTSITYMWCVVKKFPQARHTFDTV